MIRSKVAREFDGQQFSRGEHPFVADPPRIPPVVTMSERPISETASSSKSMNTAGPFPYFGPDAPTSSSFAAASALHETLFSLDNEHANIVAVGDSHSASIGRKCGPERIWSSQFNCLFLIFCVMGIPAVKHRELPERKVSSTWIPV